MSDHPPAWSIRSVVVSVRDLDRSSAFYREVMGIDEVFRGNGIAVLTADQTKPYTVYLREAPRNAVHSGQQSLGVRAVSCDVGSLAELDRVEGRLRALDAFRTRQFLDEEEKIEFVHGQDPDRISLLFVANESALPLHQSPRALARLYSIDL